MIGFKLSKYLRNSLSREYKKGLEKNRKTRYCKPSVKQLSD